MDIIKRVKSLNLPIGSYTIVGSGPLHVRGIREAQDIDMVTTEEKYQELKSAGWEEKTVGDERKVLMKDEFEISTDWTCGEHQSTTKMLIETADIIDGVAFVNLDEVMKWKMAKGREKDLRDVELIKNFLHVR
jgi:hypothetical protein